MTMWSDRGVVLLEGLSMMCKPSFRGSAALLSLLAVAFPAAAQAGKPTSSSEESTKSSASGASASAEASTAEPGPAESKWTPTEGADAQERRSKDPRSNEEILQEEYDRLDPETKAELERQEREKMEQRMEDRFSGFQNALRIGAEIPFGDVPQRGIAQVDVDSINGYVQWRFPIWADVGYRVSPTWWVGGFLQVGLGPAGDECPGDRDCFWSDFRLGLAARYHFLPLSEWDPSVGLGVGYDWFETVAVLGVDIDGTTQTLRFLRNLGGMRATIDIGADYYLGKAFSVGPFLAFSGGAWFSDTISCPDVLAGVCPSGSSVDNGYFHGSVALLARGRFGP